MLTLTITSPLTSGRWLFYQGGQRGILECTVFVCTPELSLLTPLELICGVNSVEGGRCKAKNSSSCCLPAILVLVQRSSGSEAQAVTPFFSLSRVNRPVLCGGDRHTLQEGGNLLKGVAELNRVGFWCEDGGGRGAADNSISKIRYRHRLWFSAVQPYLLTGTGFSVAVNGKNSILVRKNNLRVVSRKVKQERGT